jgi:Lon protease-like protein
MTKVCLRDNTPFGVCLIKEGHEVGQPAAPHAIGCLAHITQWDVPHPNLFAVLARGSTRFRILDTTVAGDGLIIAHIEALPEPTQPSNMERACQEVLRLAIERAGVESVPGPVKLDDPVWVSYRLAEILPVTLQEKQALLELTDTEARLARLRELMLAHGIIENINKNN